MRRLLFALGLSLGLAAGARAADPADLQGTWRAVAAERDGAPAPDVVGHELAFAGDRFRITRDGRLLYGGTWAADPAARPARIDFRQDEGPELRGAWRGIYRVEGGRLETVDNAPDVGRPRPERFAAGPGSGYVLIRFERR